MFLKPTSPTSPLRKKQQLALFSVHMICIPSYYCPKANAHKQDLEVVQQRAMQYIITKTNVYIHLLNDICIYIYTHINT